MDTSHEEVLGEATKEASTKIIFDTQKIFSLSFFEQETMTFQSITNIHS